MCGIAGIWSFREGIDEAVLRSMTDALVHRGPDDSGIYIDERNRVGFGHRRLSILDLSPLGHQPMSNDNETIWITFNGEIYNFVEIRNDLIKRGYSFRSNSDTEVIIKSYEEWGIDCVHRFIGMFALGIWDQRVKKLFLLRDRAGVKPVYYHRKEGIFMFGSELKALMKHPAFRKEIDYGVLPVYLRHGYIPAPHTIFKDTFKLRPGHYLVISEDNNIEEIKYWDITDFYLQDPLCNSEDEILEELENLLIDSFRYRLVSDVPVGVFLSGGIDSSILTALLQKKTGAKLKTFSIGFHEQSFNEAEWAKKVADYLGTDHTEYYLSVNEAFNIVQLLPEIYDEPFADNSGIPTYLLSKMTRNVATVALSADGGDELFCGYHRYRHTAKVNDFFTALPSPLKYAITKGLDVLNPDIMEHAYKAFEFAMPGAGNLKYRHRKVRHMLQKINRNELAEMYKEATSLWTTEDLRSILAHDYKTDSETCFDETFKSLKDRDLLTKMMAADFKTYLVDDVLTKLDRATMGVGLEGREPFLDHRIVEYAARIPIDLIYKDGKSKHVLRQILYKHVPRKLIERPKQGFSAPLHQWFKKDLSDMLRHYLNEERLKKEGVFNAKQVHSLVENFIKGSSVNINNLWSILMYEMWKEKWIPA